MSAFGISSLRRASLLGRSIPHYSPRSLMEISSFVKYMLMISYLAHQIKTIAKSLVNWCRRSSRCLWLESLHSFLVFKSKQMREGIFISKEEYTKDLLKRFKMDECKTIKTPMPSNGHLNLDKGGKSVYQTLYCSMIGSLLYLTASRPIMFSVYMCARF